jgi:hypothetical protein
MNLNQYKVMNIIHSSHRAESFLDIEAAFRDTQDALYWDGYSRELKLENPERYKFELDKFTRNQNFV